MRNVFIAMLVFCGLMSFSYCQESVITIDNSLAKEVSPDVAFVRFQVTNQGLNVADLKEKNDKIANQAIVLIKQHLNDNESIKTTAYRINKIYSYKDKVKVFQKYEAVNGFEVKIKDLSKISKIIQLATDAGVKNVENVNFAIEYPEKVCNELISEVTKQAKERAHIVANTLDTSILKVKSASPYCSLNSNSRRPVYFNAKMVDSAASGQENVIDSIEPGTINVNTSINLMYYLK